MAVCHNLTSSSSQKKDFCGSAEECSPVSFQKITHLHRHQGSAEKKKAVEHSHQA